RSMGTPLKRFQEKCGAVFRPEPRQIKMWPAELLLHRRRGDGGLVAEEQEIEQRQRCRLEAEQGDDMAPEDGREHAACLFCAGACCLGWRPDSARQSAPALRRAAMLKKDAAPR